MQQFLFFVGNRAKSSLHRTSPGIFCYCGRNFDELATPMQATRTTVSRPQPPEPKSATRRNCYNPLSRREVITVRGQSYVLRLANVYPRLCCGGRTHSPGGEGGGGSIFWKTQDTALYLPISNPLCPKPSLQTIFDLCSPKKRFSQASLPNVN